MELVGALFVSEQKDSKGVLSRIKASRGNTTSNIFHQPGVAHHISLMLIWFGTRWGFLGYG